MHRSVLSVVIVAAMFRLAAAQGETSDAKTWVGGEFDLLPVGTLHESVAGFNGSVDTATAVGFGGILDYRVSDLLSIGFAPRFLLEVKGQNDNSSSKQLDLRGRVTVGKEVAPSVRLYGVGTLGYSIIFLPADAMGNSSQPHGFIFSFGAGASYAINPRLHFFGELSYQFGYQSDSVNGTSFSFGDDYLTIGIGLLAALD
jgi:hypothetical protein